MKRKSFLLRIEQETYQQLEAWAQQEMRSVNGQIEYLLKLQLDDGLWNTWQSAEDLPVEDCVAHITAALAAFRGTHTRPIKKAQRWLEMRYESHADLPFIGAVGSATVSTSLVHIRASNGASCPASPASTSSDRSSSTPLPRR